MPADFEPQYGLQRRVAGEHDQRLDGLEELLTRARGMSVLDIGCNRGMICYEFHRHGAQVLHGCDYSDDAILVARSIFADIRNKESKFEVVDLVKDGHKFIREFHSRYDIVLMLATLHKIKRELPPPALATLLVALGRMTGRYFAWRGTENQHKENGEELALLDTTVGLECGLNRVVTSTISDLGPTAIWRRQ